jgi:hypothetical protein
LWLLLLFLLVLLLFLRKVISCCCWRSACHGGLAATKRCSYTCRFI